MSRYTPATLIRSASADQRAYKERGFIDISDLQATVAHYVYSVILLGQLMEALSKLIPDPDGERPSADSGHIEDVPLREFAAPVIYLFAMSPLCATKNY